MLKVAALTGFVALASVMLANANAVEASGNTMKVYADTLWVRSEPAKQASVKGHLRGGDIVIVSEERHGWYRVKSDKVQGWVAGYYLKK